MTTVRDVAQLAGVSIATVSRVINRSAKVAPATTERVRTVMDELGYESGDATGTLNVRKRTNLFAIIVPNLTNPYFSELLDIIEQEAAHQGRTLLLFNSRDDARREHACLEECVRHRVDGLFLVPCDHSPEYIEQLANQPFPVVVLTQLIAGLPSVGVDHREGGRQVAEHLLAMGHTEIGYFGPNMATEEKLTGLQQALRAEGLSIKDDNLIDVPAERYQEADLAIAAWLDRHPELPITALFTVNDIAARQAIEALTARGYRIPEDIVVVGFDNTLLAKLLGISSVSQPMREIGRLGCQEMARLIETKGAAKTANHLMLVPRLIARGSSIKVHKRKA